MTRFFINLNNEQPKVPTDIEEFHKTGYFFKTIFIPMIMINYFEFDNEDPFELYLFCNRVDF